MCRPLSLWQTVSSDDAGIVSARKNLYLAHILIATDKPLEET